MTLNIFFKSCSTQLVTRNSPWPSSELKLDRACFWPLILSSDFGMITSISLIVKMLLLILDNYLKMAISRYTLLQDSTFLKAFLIYLMATGLLIPVFGYALTTCPKVPSPCIFSITYLDSTWFHSGERSFIFSPSSYGVLYIFVLFISNQRI